MQNELALLSFGCFYIVFIFGPTYQGSKLKAIEMHIFLASLFRYSVILNHLFEVFQGLFFAFLLWRGIRWEGNAGAWDDPSWVEFALVGSCRWAGWGAEFGLVGRGPVGEGGRVMPVSLGGGHASPTWE